MAVSNRRFVLAAIVVPILFLTMSGLARATTRSSRSKSSLRCESSGCRVSQSQNLLPSVAMIRTRCRIAAIQVGPAAPLPAVGMRLVSRASAF